MNFINRILQPVVLASFFAITAYAESSAELSSPSAKARENGQSASAPSISDIVAAMHSWQSKLQQFSIVYAYQQEPLRGAYYSANHSAKRTIIEDYRFDNGRIQFYSATVSIGASPCMHVPPITYLDDSIYIKWWPLSRLARELDVPQTLSRGEEFDRQCEWLEALAFFPAKDHFPKMDEFFLPEAFAKHEYTIRPELEMIDGIPCYVVERADVDRVWLDPAKGFVIRRREWHPSNSSLILRRHNFELWDYREVQAGIWLPWMTRRESLMKVAETNQFTTTLVCHTVIANVELGTSVKRPEYLPGTIVTVDNGAEVTRSRVLPGGQEILDETAARLAVGRAQPDMGEFDVVVLALATALMAGIAITIVSKNPLKKIRRLANSPCR